MRQSVHAVQSRTIVAFLICAFVTPINAQIRDAKITLPIFSADSAWNERIDGVSTLPESESQILALYRVLLGDVTTLQPAEGMPEPWPMIVVNYDDYSIAIAIAGTGTQEVLLQEYEGAPGSATPKISVSAGYVTLPATTGPVRPSGPQGIDSDGHLVIYDPNGDRSWDIWQATSAVDSGNQTLGGGQVGTSILWAGAVDTFDTTGDGTNLPGWSSARATGPPLLAGLLLPEDVERGSIQHAIALAIPGLRNLSSDPSEPLSSDYFLPTTTTETDYINTDPQSLAAGQRLRLKSVIVDDGGETIIESELAPITRMFLTALRQYGLYLVDNAGGFVTYAEDIHTASLDMTVDEVNAVIGVAPGTPLPSGKSKWEVVMDRLTMDLDQIPIASGPWWEYGSGGKDPSTAVFGVSNFEIVENFMASPPAFDPNGDGNLTVADIFFLINHIFAGGPGAVGGGDANGDGSITVADVFYLINHLFAGGPAPS